jgi:predicted nucleotidyltransferase component of viral defense system
MDLISRAKLQNIAAERGYNLIFLEKDYFLTVLLYLIRGVDGLYFKGGTALNKIVFDHTRLSEDLDFSCRTKASLAVKKIRKIVQENPEFFTKAVAERETEKFARIHIYYKSHFGRNESINIDLNSHAKIYLKPEKGEVKHFYAGIPEFSVTMLNQKELISEKIRSLFQRNQPRDYFDAYQIITSKQKIDEKLVKRKLGEIGLAYDTGKIFRNANKIYSRWEEEITSLTNAPIAYKTAIAAIAEHFKYKDKRESNKANKTNKTNPK